MNWKILIGLVLFGSLTASAGFAAVCPAGYDYYMNKTITERSGVALPNHAVEFTMDTATLVSAGKMNASTCVMHIQTLDGTKLSSWAVDGTCNTTATRVYVKIPRITASGSYRINVCYGNLTAPVYTNEVKRVFLLADNFNQGTSINSSYWTCSSAEGGSCGVGITTNIVQNSYLNFSQGKVGGYDADWTLVYKYYTTNLKGFYVETRMKPMSTASNEQSWLRFATYVGPDPSVHVDSNAMGSIGLNNFNNGKYVEVRNARNASGATVTSDWYVAKILGNSSKTGGNVSITARKSNDNSLMSFYRGSATVSWTTYTQGLTFWRGETGTSTNYRAGWYDYAFLKNFTGRYETEPNVSYSSGELPSEAPTIIGLISVVMNTAGGTSSSLGADFNYTPTTTRTLSAITQCNLTLNGSVVKTDTSITNNTAQNFTYQFTIDDNDKCFSASVECRTNGTSGYMVNQSTPISYCLAAPHGISWVNMTTPSTNKTVECFVGECTDYNRTITFQYVPSHNKLGPARFENCTLILNSIEEAVDETITANATQEFAYLSIPNYACYSARVLCALNITEGRYNDSATIDYCLNVVESGYGNDYSPGDLVSASIDSVAGMLAGFAPISQDIGMLVAIGLIIVLVGGLIYAIIEWIRAGNKVVG